MTVASCCATAGSALPIVAADGGADRRRASAEPGGPERPTPCAAYRGGALDALALPGRSRQALAAVVDHLADGRRPVRPRARDRVRHPGGLRRDPVAELQPDPTRA